MFHDVWVGVSVTTISAGILGALAYVVKTVRYLRKLVVWTTKQMSNDGNGSWRSSVDRRLTALEIATPGVTAKPEPISTPPLQSKDKDQGPH